MEGEGTRRGEVAQTMYAHVSKCKNNKIKERKKYLYIAGLFTTIQSWKQFNFL
jgi:hypothetical protein